MKSLKGYLLIISATLFWGVSATTASFLFKQQIDVIILVQMRMTISCFVLVMFFSLFKRDVLRVPIRNLYPLALLGIIGGAGSNFTYYYTIKEINVATAILMQYMAPLLVLAYAAIAKEEELTLPKVTAGVASLSGCFFAVGGTEVSFASLSQLGLVTGILSAVCWAFANVWLRRLVQRYNVWTVLIYAFIFASIFWMFFNPPWEIITANYTSDMWVTFFGFAVISILIPHSLYFSGIRYLTASQAIITATFEPIVAIVSAFIIVGEILSPIQMGGAILVLIAIGLLQFKKEDFQPRTAIIPQKHLHD